MLLKQQFIRIGKDKTQYSSSALQEAIEYILNSLSD